MTSFNKGSYVCVVTRDQYEPYEWYINRGQFVAACKPQTLEEYNEAIRLSRIYANIKFQKCGYEKSTMDEIKKIEGKMYSTNV